VGNPCSNHLSTHLRPLFTGLVCGGTGIISSTSFCPADCQLLHPNSKAEVTEPRTQRARAATTDQACHGWRLSRFRVRLTDLDACNCPAAYTSQPETLHRAPQPPLHILRQLAPDTRASRFNSACVSCSHISYLFIRHPVRRYCFLFSILCPAHHFALFCRVPIANVLSYAGSFTAQQGAEQGPLHSHRGVSGAWRGEQGISQVRCCCSCSFPFIFIIFCYLVCLILLYLFLLGLLLFFFCLPSATLHNYAPSQCCSPFRRAVDGGE
jgi:hypothetical protein